MGITTRLIPNQIDGLKYLRYLSTRQFCNFSRTLSDRDIIVLQTDLLVASNALHEYIRFFGD
jgi:hypothetical protein